MDADYLLTATRSARRSLDLDAPVDLGDIRDCLRIATQAANGSNHQSWRWLVVTDSGIRGSLAGLYQEAYLAMTGGAMVSALFEADSEPGRLMSSTEWLVEHLAEVPLLVIPCYRPYLPSFADDEGFQQATLYGSIFPAVWNFQLALHTRGYGTCVTTMHLLRQKEVATLLGIPGDYVQGCLLPVGRLRAGQSFRPATRRPLEEVVAVDGWEGPAL
jgi:nitroreductase